MISNSWTAPDVFRRNLINTTFPRHIKTLSRFLLIFDKALNKVEYLIYDLKSIPISILV